MLTCATLVPKQFKKKAARKFHRVIVAFSIAFELSVHGFEFLRFSGLTYKPQLEKILFSCELLCFVFLFLWATFSEVYQSTVAIIYLNPI